MSENTENTEPLLENQGPQSNGESVSPNSELIKFINEIKDLYDPEVKQGTDVNKKIDDYIFKNSGDLFEKLKKLNDELEKDVNGEILQNPGKILFNKQLTNLINKINNKKILYENAFNSIQFTFTQLLDEHYIDSQPERRTYSQYLRDTFKSTSKIRSSLSKNVKLPSMPKLPKRSSTPKPRKVDLTNMDTVIDFMKNDTTLFEFLMEHKPEEKSNPDPYLVILNNFEEFIKIQKEITRDFNPKLNFYNLVFKQLEYKIIFDLCKEHLLLLLFFHNPNILLNDEKNNFKYENSNKLNYKNKYSISIDNLIYSEKKKVVTDLDKELDKATKDTISKNNFSSLEIIVRIELLKRFQQACIKKMYNEIKEKYNLDNNEIQSEEKFNKYIKNMLSVMMR